jgi:hypothetical protein
MAKNTAKPAFVQALVELLRGVRGYKSGLCPVSTRRLDDVPGGRWIVSCDGVHGALRLMVDHNNPTEVIVCVDQKAVVALDTAEDLPVAKLRELFEDVTAAPVPWVQPVSNVIGCSIPSPVLCEMTYHRMGKLDLRDPTSLDQLEALGKQLASGPPDPPLDADAQAALAALLPEGSA